MKNENLEIVEKQLPKLLIIGYGRHGKDTVCEILRDNFHYKFTSSSLFAAEKVVYPAMREHYYGVEDCFKDRHNHRAEWFELIASYNKDEPQRLAREMIEAGYDIYCGMRNRLELLACKEAKVFDLIVWVEASGRGLPPEDASSCTVSVHDADYIIYNEGTQADLEAFIQTEFKQYLFNL